jgi:fructose-bisphosphate aldolase, class II
MLLTPTQARQLLTHALQNQYAILAVNADSHAAITDCLEAAKQADSPVIIETSLWQLKGHSFGAGDSILGLTRYLADLNAIANSDKYKNIPVVYHTDHIKGPETMNILGSAIKGLDLSINQSPNGKGSLVASTISLDASEFTEEENITYICELCKIANEMGVTVTLEMESAVDDGITPFDESERLLGAVEERYPDHIYLWAPGVGTQHGFTSDDGYSGFNPKVVEDNVKLIRRITGREFGLALHGSTGLSQDKLTAASKAGVTKVNWSSESLYIRSMAAKEYYSVFEEKFERKHKEWKNTVMDNGVNAYISKAYIPKVIERFEVLGSVGMASSFQKSENG